MHGCGNGFASGLHNAGRTKSTISFDAGIELEHAIFKAVTWQPAM